jgi:hypothetical protein
MDATSVTLSLVADDNRDMMWTFEVQPSEYSELIQALQEVVDVAKDFNHFAE